MSDEQGAPLVGAEELPQEGDGLTLEALQAELKRARTEAAGYRRRLRDAEQSAAEHERGKLSDLERLQAELTEAKQALGETQRLAQERLVRNTVIAAAARAGFNDPEDATRLVDTAALEMADDGTVNGVDQAIQAIAKSKPYLLRAKQPAIALTNPDGGPQRPSDEQLRRELFGGRAASPFWSGAGVVMPGEK